MFLPLSTFSPSAEEHPKQQSDAEEHIKKPGPSINFQFFKEKDKLRASLKPYRAAASSPWQSPPAAGHAC
jgi:hypothetical protein